MCRFKTSSITPARWSRGVSSALVVADLPIHSYDHPDLAVQSSRLLIDAGAEGVKLEGGQACSAQIRAITDAGIPFLGHIGMLPQHVLEEGGYRRKGRTPQESDYLLNEAKVIEENGGFAIVLELIEPSVAAKITASVSIPTIGIGSGTECDGQILVFHDLVGYFPWFKPKHVKSEGNVAGEIRKAARAYIERTRGGVGTGRRIGVGSGRRSSVRRSAFSVHAERGRREAPVRTEPHPT